MLRNDSLKRGLNHQQRAGSYSLGGMLPHAHILRPLVFDYTDHLRTSLNWVDGDYCNGCIVIIQQPNLHVECQSSDSPNHSTPVS